MRRRLVASILSVVIVTLVVTGFGTVLLEQRTATSTAEQGLAVEAEATAAVLGHTNATVSSSTLALLRQISGAETLVVVGMRPGGTFAGALPSPLSARTVDIPELQDARTVAGNVGATVFVAAPLVTLLGNGVREGSHIPASDLPVLVLTRRVPNSD